MEDRAAIEGPGVRLFFHLTRELMHKRATSMLAYSTLLPQKLACLFHDERAAREHGLAEVERMWQHEHACENSAPFLRQKVVMSISRTAAVAEIMQALERVTFRLDQIPTAVLDRVKFACGGIWSTLMCEHWIRECRVKKEHLEQLNKSVSAERRLAAALESSLLTDFERTPLPCDRSGRGANYKSFFHAHCMPLAKEIPGILRKKTWASFTPGSYAKLIGDQALFAIVCSGGCSAADAAMVWKTELLTSGMILSSVKLSNLFWPCGTRAEGEGVWLNLGNVGCAAVLWPMRLLGGSAYCLDYSERLGKTSSQ